MGTYDNSHNLDEMNGRDGNVSPLALAGGSSAAIVRSPPHPSESPEGGEAVAEGGRTRAIFIAEGGRTRWTRAIFDSSQNRWKCRLCEKPFKSPPAVNGHQRVHKRKPMQQEKAAPISADFRKLIKEEGSEKLIKEEGSEMKGDDKAVVKGGAFSSAEEAKRKKIHAKLDLNKEPPEDDENDDEDHDGDEKCGILKSHDNLWSTMNHD